MLLDFFTVLVSGSLILVGIWIITIVIVFITLFKRTDITLTAKFFWAFIIFIAPVIGLIVYLFFGLSRRKKLLEVDQQKTEL